MNRRDFLNVAPLAAGTLVASSAYAQAPFADEKSKLKITGVRLVQTRPRGRCPPTRRRRVVVDQTRSKWPTRCRSIPNTRRRGRSFSRIPARCPRLTVEITTDKGIKGYGNGGPGRRLRRRAAPHEAAGRRRSVQHRTDLGHHVALDDVLRPHGCGRSTRSAASISRCGTSSAKRSNMPVYKLLGGETKPRLPAYCTGNDIEQHVEFGYKRLKLAIPHGPADGREGMRKNVELVQARARGARAGRRDHARLLDGVDRALHHRNRRDDGAVPRVLDGRVPAAARLRGVRPAANQQSSPRASSPASTSTRATASASCSSTTAPSIWQPDIHWCGGLTELRRIAALAAAYDIPVIPHGGGRREARALHHGDDQQPLGRDVHAGAGRSERGLQAVRREDNKVTRGPEGIYVRPSDAPGFGWDFVVT